MSGMKLQTDLYSKLKTNVGILNKEIKYNNNNKRELWRFRQLYGQNVFRILFY